MTLRLLGLLPALAACDSVVDDTYRGDTKARIQAVIASPAIAAEDIAAFVVWDGAYATNFDDLRTATLPINTWLSYQRLEIALHEPPPVEYTDRGTVNGRIVVADLARVHENADGTFDISDALVGTADQIGADYRTVHAILQHQPFTIEQDGEVRQQRGYNLLAAHGEMTINCTPQEIADCIALYHSHPHVTYSPEEIDSLCRSPRQEYGGFGAFEALSFTATTLPLVLTNGTIHVCSEAMRCFYRTEDLPTCP